MSKKLIAGAGVVASFAVALAPLATFATVRNDADHGTPNAQTDRLSVTIESVCSFGHAYDDGTTVTAGSHVDGSVDTGSSATGTGTVKDYGSDGKNSTANKGTGKWAALTLTGYDGVENTSVTTDDTADTDTLYGIMENSTKTENFGQTILNVVCNNKQGYKLTAAPNNLVGTINNDEAIEWTQAAIATNGNKSTWALKVTADSTYKNTAALTSIVDDFTDTFTSGNPIVQAADISHKNGDKYTITYGVGINATQPADTYEGAVVYNLYQLPDAA